MSDALPEPAPRVAAIVVNYDGREVTLDAVRSLRAMRYPAWELVVLDNASRDGSVAALAAAFPDLRQLRLATNRGSSSGYAAAMEWAFGKGYDYVLLLNNDIEVDPEMLAELVRVAASNPRIGAVGPKCYFHGEPTRLWSAGGVLRFRESITRERGYGELDRGQYDADGDIGYVLNPVLVEVSGEPQAIGEGCLSVPGLWHDAVRYPWAKVVGIDLDGNEVVLEGEGLLAQALQHETDHLDGTLYLDRLTPEGRRVAMREIRESDWF